MARVLLFLIAAVIILTIVAVVDCALTTKTRVRGIPKWAWLLIVVVIPFFGAVLWFVLGRGKGKDASPLATPDDDPTFLRGLDADERLRKLEEELAKLDEEEFGSDDKPTKD